MAKELDNDRVRQYARDIVAAAFSADVEISVDDLATRVEAYFGREGVFLKAIPDYETADSLVSGVHLEDTGYGAVFKWAAAKPAKADLEEATTETGGGSHAQYSTEQGFYGQPRDGSRVVDGEWMDAVAQSFSKAFVVVSIAGLRRDARLPWRVVKKAGLEVVRRGQRLKVKVRENADKSKLVVKEVAAAEHLPPSEGG